MSTRDLSDYSAVTEYLFSLKARGVKFGIDRMRQFAEALGHPERAVPIIHVAGTNGKGSVSAMLDSIFHAAGWHTGLYTSPHLVKLGERVQVDRHALSEAEIIAYTNELRPLADAQGTRDPDLHPSFFEFMTAMAFLQFQRKTCDIAVVEVGMGGRLDATNVVTPEVSVITSIGLDHCEFLGGTLAAIAGEKAGIIKPGRPVVMGRVPTEAEEKIRHIAAERGAPLISVAEVFGENLGRYPQTNLEGDYQQWNAATATLVAQAMDPRWKLTSGVIATGLRNVDWPGRWQRTQLGGRLTILDASHNPEGAQVLEAGLKKLVAETGRAPVVITGVLGAARAQPLLETISRYAKEIHLAIPNQARASSFDELEALVPKTFSGKVRRATVKGLFPKENQCTAGGPDDVIVVTGSIYLLGEVMERLEPQRGTGEGKLQDF